MVRTISWILVAGCVIGCAQDTPVDPPPAQRGVVFTYPNDRQRDVPTGAHLIVSFSDAESAGAPGVTVVGPDGAVAVTVTPTQNGKTLVITSDAFATGTTYAIHLAGESGEPLLTFTTRSDRPLAGAPALVAINGSDPVAVGTFRPMFETSTLQLVFSEPLDPRAVAVEPGAIELLDAAGTVVPVELFARGIHVVLDPAAPLVAGALYELRLGDRLVDVGGERLAPSSVMFTPIDSLGAGPTQQTFRTRADGDPLAALARRDTSNTMEVSHPLIGTNTAAVNPSVLATELGDPAILGGPIAFTIPKGQRLSSSALDISLAGAVPSGLATGDIRIEMLTDGGGRIYRNRYRSDDTLPDNDYAPLLVDLTFDLAIYAADETGNGVLAQTILGAQLSGLALADDGALGIETLGAIEIDLLGVTAAPTNLVLALISDLDAQVAADAQAPSLITSLPAADSHDWVADEGLELVFDEPIDLARARAGGLTFHDVAGAEVPHTLEAHGSVVVVRPRAPLRDQEGYRIDLLDVADVAGNLMEPRAIVVRTQAVVQTDVPASVVAVQPGTPCALVDATATNAGRCAGGATGDDRYQPFRLAAGDHVAVVFDQRMRPESITLGAACNTGSVRVEQLDAQGACVAAVPGTLIRRQRELAFVPDRAWVPEARYRVRLISGPNGTCDGGEICGANGRPANFDPLAGSEAAGAGGPDLVIDFLGAVSTDATTLFTSASPHVDLNGSGRMEPGEAAREENRVALRVKGTSGIITSASFDGADCIPGTPEKEGCMYMLGAIPAQLGARRDQCALPDGTTAATCIPVTMTAQAMHSTSLAMTAAAIGIAIPTETGMTVMRLREPKEGPLEGYIVERGGVPTMVVALALYMDAPNMHLPIGQHDMRSKPLSVALEGPVSFRPDGRIALELKNLADVPLVFGISALGLTGGVELVVPAGEMRLQLVSAPQRGGLP